MMFKAVVVPESLQLRWRDIVLCLKAGVGADGVRLLRRQGSAFLTLAASGDPAPAGALHAEVALGQSGQRRSGAAAGGGSYVGLPLFWPDASLFGVLEVVSLRPDAFSDAHEHLMAQWRGAIEDQLALLSIDRIDAASVSAARRDSEEALRISEQRFRLLVENALDDFFMHDDKGRFIDVNERACRNLGYTREELLTMSAADVSQGLTQAEKEELYRTTQPGASAMVHARHIRKDGTSFPVEVLISCHMIAGRKLFLGMVRDISEREEAQQALQRLNAALEERVVSRTRELGEMTERLQAVMDHADDAIALTDTQGRHLLFNRAAERLSGREAATMLGRTPEDVYGPEAGARIARHVRQVLASGEASSIEENWGVAEERVLATTRSPRRGAQGEIVGLVAISRDVTERKLAEDALRLERERMTLAVEVGGLGILDCRLDEQSLVCNAEWARMFGLAPAAVTLPVLAECLHPDDRAQVEAQLRHVIAGGQGEQTLFRIRVGAQTRWLSAAARRVAATPLTHARLVCVASDVTERQRADSKLKESYESLRQAERLARIGSWTLHLETGVFSTSEMLYEMNGREVGSAITPADLRRMMPPDDYARVDAAIQRCIQTGEPYGVDVEHFKPSGGRFAAHIRGQAIRDEHGRIVALAGTVQDISEREAARAQLAAIADSLPNGAIYRIDYLTPDLGRDGTVLPQDMRVSYVSAGIENLIGVPADGVMQNPALLVAAIHEDDRGRYLETSRQATLGQKLFECEFRLIRPDGQLVWLQVRSAPREAEHGRVWDGIILDVTREHEIAEALRQAKDAAEAAERAKAEFLATMSHEIRTPMNSVIGMTRLALQTPLSPKQKNYLDKIDISAKALLGIINDILDFSRIEAGGLVLEETEYTLDGVLESVSNATSLRAEEKGLEIVYALAPDAPRRLIGDPLRLSQVLINLVSNAVKFTAEGEVVVSAATLPGTADRPARLRFSVRDTGIGLEPAQIANLFKPFSQADSRTTRHYGGTGLGLSISKRLVGLMGGDIWVESVPGVGSTFHFTIALREAVPRGPAGLPPFRGKRVLIVDDVDTARETLSGMMAQFGIDAESVASGAGALAALHAAMAQGRPFDLVLMDWRMPGMDGIETARRIRADRSLPHVPAVLMVTAYGREEVLRYVDALDLQGLLIKPVTESMMFDAIQHVFSLHAGSGEPVAPEAEAPAYPAILRGSRVLLVDDNAFNLEVATEFLALAGVRVVTATSGQEGLEQLARAAFDAVLMDMQMPEMDGLEATRRIRAQPAFRDLPIIALTAQARVEDREATLSAGMTAHLTKPIDENRMYETLAAVLQGRSAPPAPAASGGAADPAAAIDLVRTRQRVRGDQARLDRLLRGFLRDFSGSVGELADVLGQGDHDGVAALAHKVKGAAGYVSADALVAAAETLEVTAWEGGSPISPSFSSRGRPARRTRSAACRWGRWTTSPSRSARCSCAPGSAIM